MNWQPTPELQWLKTEKTYPVDNSGFTQHMENGKLVTERKVTFRVLQQKWEDRNKVLSVTSGSNGFMKTDYAFEWRDIPTVKL